jgi:hypothetical protein
VLFRTGPRETCPLGQASGLLDAGEPTKDSRSSAANRNIAPPASPSPEGAPEVHLEQSEDTRIFPSVQKPAFSLVILVDETGIEPATSSLRTMRSPS